MMTRKTNICRYELMYTLFIFTGLWICRISYKRDCISVVYMASNIESFLNKRKILLSTKIFSSVYIFLNGISE